MGPAFARLAFCTATVLILQLGPASAWAAASSSASISNLTIQLIDLDPLDGVTPWITFAGNSYAFTSAQDTGPAAFPDGTSVGGAAFDAVARSDSAAATHATAAATGSSPALPITGSLTLAGSLLGSGSTGGTVGAPGNWAAYDALSMWNGFFSNAFTLSAKTRVVFSATAQGTAAVTTAYDPSAFGSNYNYEYAGAAAAFYLYGPSSSGNGNQNVSDTPSVAVNNTSAFDPITNAYVVPAPASFNQTIGGAFVNNTAGDMSGSFYAYVQAYGQSWVSAVPEPATPTLLLAGLGAVGAVARRRPRYPRAFAR